MRTQTTIALCTGWLLSSPLTAQDIDRALLDRVDAILREAPLIDGHNDLPSSLLDAAVIDRLFAFEQQAGGMHI